MRPLLHRSALGLACLALLGAAAGAAADRSGADAASAAPCRADVSNGVLPEWARAGFSDKQPKMPHVVGRSGDIAAIIFGYPLYFPEAKSRGNKVLWVSRVHQRPLDDLYIRAQRMDGSRKVGPLVHRVIANGPGPSYVNLPADGCWRLQLRWSGHTDSLDLRYRKPPA
jgi:hypothetical protein